MIVGRRGAVIALVAALLLQAFDRPTFSQDASAGAPISLRGAGSTFASLLYKKWIDTYRGTYPNVSITYDAVGSGEGIARFAAEMVDFAGSDLRLSNAEIAKIRNGAIMVPTTAGMIAVVYNLPGVNTEIKLPRDVFADIFAGTIMRWDDSRIRDANPGVTFPKLEIILVARLDASGTTSVFTEHLAAIKPTWRELGIGIGTLVKWPTRTMFASGNEGIVARIKITEGAIGYVEFGFAQRFGLPMALLQNRSGRFVAPDAASGQLALSGGAPPLDDLAASVIDPVGPGSYPIISYSWTALNRRFDDERKGIAIREFIDWGLSHGQEAGVAIGYVPLPTAVTSMGKLALGAPGL